MNTRVTVRGTGLFSRIIGLVAGVMIVGAPSAHAEIRRNASIDGLHIGTEVTGEHPNCPASLRNAPAAVKVKMLGLRMRGRYVGGRAGIRMYFDDDSQSMIKFRNFRANPTSWDAGFSDRCRSMPDADSRTLRHCFDARSGRIDGELERAAVQLRLMREEGRRLRLRMYVSALDSESQEIDENGNTYTRRTYSGCWTHRFAVMTD